MSKASFLLVSIKYKSDNYKYIKRSLLCNGKVAYFGDIYINEKV